MGYPPITDKQYLELTDKYQELKNSLEGKTLIGTCGGESPCRHWRKEDKNCLARKENRWEPNDGCIDWKEKP